MTSPTVVPPPRPIRPIVQAPDGDRPAPDGPTLRIVPWVDPVADPHGVHPCSRYVELYWLGIIGPSTTWLLRRLHYGLEIHGDGYDLHLPETARSLGLGDRMGRNAPFRRALARLVTFELARAQGPGELAVRTRIPPLPLRHLSRLPESLQRSHRRWTAEQQLPEPEQMRRRALRLATGLAEAGHDRAAIEQRLVRWQFHPAVVFHAAGAATASRPESSHASGGQARADAVPDGAPGDPGPDSSSARALSVLSEQPPREGRAPHARPAPLAVRTPQEDRTPLPGRPVQPCAPDLPTNART